MVAWRRPWAKCGHLFRATAVTCNPFTVYSHATDIRLQQSAYMHNSASEFLMYSKSVTLGRLCNAPPNILPKFTPTAVAVKNHKPSDKWTGTSSIRNTQFKKTVWFVIPGLVKEWSEFSTWAPNRSHFLPARRYASASRPIRRHRVSVCPSVRHTPVLC